MEDEHRETLRRHRVFFVENVDVQHLFIHLVQRDVFSSDDCERIRKQGLTRMDRAELFLDTLVTRGPRAFDALCDALRQRYDFVVRRFLDEESSSSSEDIDSIGLSFVRSKSLDRLDMLAATTSLPLSLNRHQNGGGTLINSFQLRSMREQLYEQIHLLETVRTERDDLLHRLAALEADSLELKRVRSWSRALQDQNDQLLKDRDSALQKFAVLNGQFSVIFAEYTSAKNDVQTLRNELHVRSAGVESSILRRLCSEMSAKYEFERVNHVKAQLELTEVKTTSEALEREAETLRETRQRLVADVERLEDELRRTSVEAAHERKHATSLRGDLELMRRQSRGRRHVVGAYGSQRRGGGDGGDNDGGNDGVLRGHRVAILMWEKERDLARIQQLEQEINQLKESAENSRHNVENLESELVASKSQCERFVAQNQQLTAYATNASTTLQNVETAYEETMRRCVDVETQRNLANERLRLAVDDLERMEEQLDVVHRDLVRARRHKTDSLRQTLARENESERRDRETADVRKRLRDAERTIGVERRYRDEATSALGNLEKRIEDARLLIEKHVADCRDVVRTSVKLNKNGKALPGFSVERGIFVKDVKAGSCAAGVLKPGDKLIKVDGVHVSKLPAECIQDGVLYAPTSDAATSTLLGLTVDRLSTSRLVESIDILANLRFVVPPPPPPPSSPSPPPPSLSVRRSPLSQQTSSSSLATNSDSKVPQSLSQFLTPLNPIKSFTSTFSEPRSNKDFSIVIGDDDVIAKVSRSASSSSSSVDSKEPRVTRRQVTYRNRDSRGCRRNASADAVTAAAAAAAAARERCRRSSSKSDDEGKSDRTARRLTSKRRSATLPGSALAGLAAAVLRFSVCGEMERVTRRLDVEDEAEEEEDSDVVMRSIELSRQRENNSSSIGICGGRGYGIYVSAVYDSHVKENEILTGSRIVEISGIDMRQATFEEAYVALRSSGNDIRLRVDANMSSTSACPLSARDAFFVRAHFSHKDSSPRLNICLGDVFFVTDTLHEDTIGLWYACKLSRSGEVVEKGVIPNFERANQIMGVDSPNSVVTTMTSSTTTTTGSGRLVRGLRRGGVIPSRFVPRGVTVLDGNVSGFFNDAMKKTSFRRAYECVDKAYFKFCRPVVLVGPSAGRSARDLSKLGGVFMQLDSLEGVQQETERHLRLQDGNYVTTDAVLKESKEGKCCVLVFFESARDISRLIQANLYPIVIYLQPKSSKKLSKMMNLADDTASATYIGAMQEENRLSAAHLLTAKMMTGRRPTKTAARLADLVKIIQESLHWLPSPFQLQNTDTL